MFFRTLIHDLIKKIFKRGICINARLSQKKKEKVRCFGKVPNATEFDLQKVDVGDILEIHDILLENIELAIVLKTDTNHKEDYITLLVKNNHEGSMEMDENFLIGSWESKEVSSQGYSLATCFIKQIDGEECQDIILKRISETIKKDRFLGEYLLKDINEGIVRKNSENLSEWLSFPYGGELSRLTAKNVYSVLKTVLNDDDWAKCIIEKYCKNNSGRVLWYDFLYGPTFFGNFDFAEEKMINITIGLSRPLSDDVLIDFLSYIDKIDLIFFSNTEYREDWIEDSIEDIPKILSVPIVDLLSCSR